MLASTHVNGQTRAWIASIARPHYTAGNICGPIPSAVTGWVTDGAPLDPAAWAAACNNTIERQACNAPACGTGFTGTLSAVCTVSEGFSVTAQP
jgi:hypothetical protein